MTMQLTILGCGPSGGVPFINGTWGLCDPNNPKNRRTRTSSMIHWHDKNILIDTSPDLRQQLLQNGIGTVDAVLYTHDHADHTHGIDELRSLFYTQEKCPIPIYGDQETLESLQSRFYYLFRSPQKISDASPFVLEPKNFTCEPFDILGLRTTPFIQDHGSSHSIGYRFEDFAYSTDVVELDEKAFEILNGVKTWFVDCLSWHPKPSHSHLDKTLKWIDRVKPQKAVLIHMNHDLDYDTLKTELPKNVEPAYDGMVIHL